MASDEEMQQIIERISADYVHRLYPSLRRPAYVALPTSEAELHLISAIEVRAARTGIAVEVIDLTPDPGSVLSGLTTRLRSYGTIGSERTTEPPGSTTQLILRGFDCLEGDRNDAPTYPFRSVFQFDEAHLWLFLGRSHARLARIFDSHSKPLWRAAACLTPKRWQ